MFVPCEANSGTDPEETRVLSECDITLEEIRVLSESMDKYTKVSGEIMTARVAIWGYSAWRAQFSGSDQAFM